MSPRKPLPEWQIYASQLYTLGYGIPLWQPAPIHSYSRVQIGDVGYIRDGCFHLLFSAGPTMGERKSGEDVPEGFSPLDVGPIVKIQPRKPGYLKSTSLRALGGLAEASLDDPTGLISGSAEVHFESSRSEGAVLATKHKTFRDNTERLGRFKQYMLQNYKSWVAFANDNGHGIHVEDLILVTGRDMTEDFAMLAFSHNEGHFDAKFEAGVAHMASAGVSGWGSWKTELPVFENWGPQARDPEDFMEATDLNPLAPLKKRPQFDQCVFLRGYRVHRRAGLRILPTVIRAGAGPHDLGGHPRDHPNFPVYIDPKGRSNFGHTPYDLPNTQKGTHEFQDPLEPLVDYLFENAGRDINVAIVHDDDWAHIQGVELTSPPVPKRRRTSKLRGRSSVREVRPQVQVEGGVVSLGIPNGRISRAILPDTPSVTLSASLDSSDLGLDKQRWVPLTMLQDGMENRFQEWGGPNLLIPNRTLAPFYNDDDGSGGMTSEHTGEESK